jgi:hypothetical protein
MERLGQNDPSGAQYGGGGSLSFPLSVLLRHVQEAMQQYAMTVDKLVPDWYSNVVPSPAHLLFSLCPR